MNKAKFTDGPWHNKGKRVFWNEPDRKLPKDNLFNGLVCICATTEDNPPEVIEEAHANARLIAQAPAMYKMLEDLSQAMWELGRINPVCAVYSDKIDELLANARGE